jgi:hypothetical protein
MNLGLDRSFKIWDRLKCQFCAIFRAFVLFFVFFRDILYRYVYLRDFVDGNFHLSHDCKGTFDDLDD